MNVTDGGTVPPTGACCASSGACTITTETVCAAPSVWQGENTICNPNPCPQPPPITCPAGALIEGEPLCQDNYIDNYNGGCNSTPVIWQMGPAGRRLRRHVRQELHLPPYGGSNRDTDWYLSVSCGAVTYSMTAEFPFMMALFTGTDCAGLVYTYYVGKAGEPAPWPRTSRLATRSGSSLPTPASPATRWSRTTSSTSAASSRRRRPRARAATPPEPASWSPRKSAPSSAAPSRVTRPAHRRPAPRLRPRARAGERSRHGSFSRTPSRWVRPDGRDHARRRGSRRNRRRRRRSRPPRRDPPRFGPGASWRDEAAETGEFRHAGRQVEGGKGSTVFRGVGSRPLDSPGRQGHHEAADVPSGGGLWHGLGRNSRAERGRCALGT